MLSFLDEQKIPYLPLGDEDKDIQADCPLCTDSRKRLGIRIKATKLGNSWHCFNCSSKGKSLNTLKKAMAKLKKLNRSSFVEYKSAQTTKPFPKELSDKMHEALFKVDKAIKYLTEKRGLTEDCIKHFKLGFRTKFKKKEGNDYYDAGPHIALPAFEDEKLVYIKYRNISKDQSKSIKWRREKNGKTILFNNDVLYDHD